MKPEEKLVCDYIYNFVQENWDKMNHDKIEIKQTKEEFLEEVKTDIQTAMWVLSEVATWGMDDRDYLKELYCDTGDTHITVIKINDKYIRIKWISPLYHLSFVEPKTKTVIYFE